MIGPRGTAALHSISRKSASQEEARLAAVPTQLHWKSLWRWSPQAARALNKVPRLLPPTTGSTVPSYCALTKRQRQEVRQSLIRPVQSVEEVANMFVRPKPGKKELRLIVDARRLNVRDKGWVRIGPPCPNVADVAHFLRRAEWASTADLKNYFYSIPIGERLSRLFVVPELGGGLSRLPMGWSRAPDIASAITKSMTEEVDPGAAMVCIDNILLSGKTRDEVRRRMASVDRKVGLFGATYSEPLSGPTRCFKFYGIQWDLQRRRRRLPVQFAMSASRYLRRFACSKGPRSLREWRKTVGLAGWIATTGGLDVTRRLGLISGLRVAQHKPGGVVPGARARKEARKHAESALKDARLEAFGERTMVRSDPSYLSLERTWLVVDAAVPGAMAVVRFSTGRAPELVFWERVQKGTAAVTAEMDAMGAAAEYAKRQGLVRPVYVTDNRSVYHMVGRGVARNSRHHRAIEMVRMGPKGFHMVWVASENNLADGPSRAGTYARAKKIVASLDSGCDLHAPKPEALCFRLRD